MKKLVTTGLRKRSMSFLLGCMSLVISCLPISLVGQDCVISCPPMDPPIEIGLSAACIDTITYDEIAGVFLQNCSPGEVTVEFFDNGVPIGNVITAEMIGNIYMAIITHTESGQSCMFTVIIVDTQAPIVVCPDDVTLTCTADLEAYSDIDINEVEDCSPVTMTIDDSPIFLSQCFGNIISQYLRTYTIRDSFLNTTVCEQIISLEKAAITDVTFPPDLSGLTALSCFPVPDTSPDNTGYPSVDGGEIIGGNHCNLLSSFTDLQIPLCSGSYKIMRTWTVMDWCINSSTTAVQLIEVIDNTPPVVVAPADITISTAASICLADALIAAADVSDDCSLISSIRMQTPFGTIHSNGGLVSGLPIGVHIIVFIARNDCGLEGQDMMLVTVEDLQPPVPVCNQALTIPLNNEGNTVIPAYVFNAASIDNCGDVYFKVKRMAAPVGYSCANPGNPTNLFDDAIQFCCGDIPNNNIMVILRVYDVQPIAGPVPDTYLSGHFNDCMVQVEVQDKLPPQIICPSDITISCEYPYTLENLDVFGTVALAEEDREEICINDPGFPGNPGIQCIGLDGLALDNCGVTVTSEAVEDVNMCGVGTIIRTFIATDPGGAVSTCEQVISIINYDLFDESQITWPSDLTTTNICEIDLLDPEDLSLPYSEPVFEDGPCDLVAATYEDDVFDFSNNDQACFKILRTWTVIDWCQLNQGYGTWTHLQVIKVMNSIAPVIAPIEDITTCSFDPACGGLELDFEAVATDDCSSANSLTWRYFIDIDNNGVFDFTSSAIVAGSIQFAYEMPIGNHRIVYAVSDQCGNSTVEEQLVSVESCKAPSAKCLHGLSTNLMAMDTDGDGEADWGMVVLQAEMFDAGSDHPCGNAVTVAFSADPHDVTRVFDCSDLGANEIELWAIDENGLTDFCITTVDIQDNNGICPPGLGNGSGVISGSILVPNSGKLSGAMVHLDGSNLPGSATNGDGYFVFPSMPYGGSYTVRPVKDGDDRNGVTTLDLVKIQKHLLGISAFTTPYDYIAADANNSGSVTAIDILQLRKLILGFYNDLPNNTSWRFVDDAHVFPDEHNPWASAWPETYVINPFDNNMSNVNFDAVKVGDINRTASLAATGNGISSRSGEKCLLVCDVNAHADEDVYRVDVYLENASEYNALQFSFDWDKTSYSIVDWSPSAWLTEEDIRLSVQTGESSALAAFTMTAWPAGRMPLFTIWVKRESPNANPFQLFLKPKPTAGIAYKTSEEEVGVSLGTAHQPAINVHNRPNPFSDLTTIVFSSDRTEMAVLRISDVSGKVILTKSVSLITGLNEFIVQRHEIKTAGMFIYEIESNFQYSTNRMIIVD